MLSPFDNASMNAYMLSLFNNKSMVLLKKKCVKYPHKQQMLVWSLKTSERRVQFADSILVT